MNKKLISLILCVSIILPTLCVGVISYAKANPDMIDLSFLGNGPKPEINISQAASTGDLVSEWTENEPIAVEIPDAAEEVYKGTKKTIGVNENEKLTANENVGATDLYNLGKTEIEELLNNGYTLKEIFEADEIGNRILENPANLLEKSKNEQKELKDIEKAIMTDRKQVQFDNLKEKYPKEYTELKNEQLSDQDISTLLSFYDRNDVKSIKELAKQYKENGDKALIQASKAKVLSKGKKDKYGISEAEAEGLNDEVLASLEELSKKINKPVKELIKGMKAAQSRIV